MLRQRRFCILVCFLVAITSNCIQASYISVSQAANSECLVNGAPDGEQTADSAFIVSDDDPDDILTKILAQTPLENILAFSNLHLNMSTALTTARAERHTVLRL